MGGSIVFYLGLALGIWILIDSRQRQIRTIWVPLFILFSVFVPYLILPIYLVFRFNYRASSEGKSSLADGFRLCSKCGHENRKSSTECVECGAQLAL